MEPQCLAQTGIVAESGRSTRVLRASAEADGALSIAQALERRLWHSDPGLGLPEAFKKKDGGNADPGPFQRSNETPDGKLIQIDSVRKWATGSI